MFLLCWSLYGASYVSGPLQLQCVLYFSDSQPGVPVPQRTPLQLPAGTLKDCEVAVSSCVHVQHMHVCKSCGTDYEPTAPAAELKQMVDLERRCLLLQCICLCCDRGTTLCWNYTAVQVQVVEDP